MENNQVFYLVTVRVKTPVGCKPRIFTQKGIVSSSHPLTREEAHAAALELVSGHFGKEYPKLELKYQVTGDLYNYKFFKVIE